MRRQDSIIYHVIVFTLAQLSWFSLLGIWIYWYISNYILLSEVGTELSSQFLAESTNVGALVSGIILLVVISVAMSLIFIYLTRQMNITRFYDNFIANVTHELKSPLSSIQLYLETLKSRDIQPEKQKEFLTSMLKDTERLNKLITSILDISGMEQKKLAYNFKLCDADDTVRRLISEACAEFKVTENAIKIEGRISGQFVVDQRAMQIVINNLFDNATKYSKSPLQLQISLSNTQKFHVIVISDRGIGISKSDQNKIFRKFQRVYSSISPNVKGTGLGLYWVKEIIRSHGGSISVSSAGRDAGTTFEIEIPIYQASKIRYLNRLLKLTKRRNQTSESNNE